MIQPRRSSEAYDGSYGDFCFYLFSFYFKGSRDFSNIDCTGSGSWWKWPWNKLDLSTSYLCPINITLEIIIFFWSKWGDGEKKKKINESFCFVAHTLLQVCLEWALWQMTRWCAPTWCNTPQVHISLNSGFHGSLPKISFLLLFSCLSFVLKFIIHYT